MKRVTLLLALASLIFVCAPVSAFAQAHHQQGGHQGGQPVFVPNQGQGGQQHGVRQMPPNMGVPQGGHQQQHPFTPAPQVGGGQDYRGQHGVRQQPGVQPGGYPQYGNRGGQQNGDWRGQRGNGDNRGNGQWQHQPGNGDYRGNGDNRGNDQWRGRGGDDQWRGQRGGDNRGGDYRGQGGQHYRPPYDPGNRSRGYDHVPQGWHPQQMRPDRYTYAERSYGYRGRWDYGRYGYERFGGYHYNNFFFDFSIIGGNYQFGFFAGRGFVPTPYLFAIEYGRWYRPGYNGYVTQAPYQYGYMGPITVLVTENVYVGDDYYGNPVFEPETFAYNAFPYWTGYGYEYGYYDYEGNFRVVY